MTFSELWDRLVCVLYPPRCVLCDAVTEYDRLCCRDCALVKTPLKLENAAQPLQGVLSPLEYSGNVRNAILTLKTYPDERASQFLFRAMSEILQAHWEQLHFDWFVPVPLHPAGLASRGFNQAQLLAEMLAEQLQTEVIDDALRRLDSTQPQHLLGQAERLENARASYRIGAGAPANGGRILLVDDVYTTGATMKTCAHLLLRAGADEVYGIAASHAPRPHTQNAPENTDSPTPVSP